jgi:hypothetical protein
MMIAPVSGIALVVAAALGPALDPDPSLMSDAQRSAAVRPLVQHATECIARTVAAEKRYRGEATNVGDLILESMPKCIESVRAMVDGYDRYFGDGSGEAFFMGPYLEVLPGAVNTLAKEPGGKR